MGILSSKTPPRANRGWTTIAFGADMKEVAERFTRMAERSRPV